MSQPQQPDIYDEIDAEVKKQGKFIKMQSGEKLTLQFVTEPRAEKIHLVDKEYHDEKSGKTTKSKRVQYAVIDPKNPSEEKTLELALRFSGQLNALLKKGLKLIEIQRQGVGTSTNYVFVPL